MHRGLNPELGLAILRVVMGVIFFAHGWPKISGGIEVTAGSFATLGIPLPLVAAWLIMLLETVGGVMLIVGFLVTPVAVLQALHMITGIVLVGAANGFYVIGPGSDGVEYNLLLLAGCLTLILAGPGLAALDARRRPDRI